MNILVLALIVAWSIRLLRNTLSYAALWFIKEYRVDRMRIHLSPDPWRRVFIPAFRLPPRSPKAILLTCGTIALLGAFLLYAPANFLVRFFIADLGHFVLTAFLVVLMNVPTKAVHDAKIRRGIAMLRAKPSMLVVGITGSFGKTSVKDYAASILATQYSTLKTEASKNSPIGIAEVVLAKLASQEMFVVEMGAYKKGEIAQMTDMVRPQVGVITAINAQHQDLFGTIENTMEAKYELIAGLTGKRIAIMNADDARVRTMGSWAMRDGIHVWWYSRKITNFKSQISNERTFLAKDIRETETGIAFTCVEGGNTVHVRANVVGEHQVSNILASIAVGVACGMTLEAACAGVRAIRPVRGVLTRIAGVNGSTFIDDTFNNNPDAAKAALAVLAHARGRKVLVFQPMIELGAYAQESHRDVGEVAGRVCDAVILTNGSWYEDFVSGVRAAQRGIPVYVYDTKKAVAEIHAAVKDGDTVLFKGKEAGLVLKALEHL